MHTLKIPHQARAFPPLPRPGVSRPIYPLFLPFAGCPQRCLFCAQDAQSGRGPDTVQRLLAEADRQLQRGGRRAGPAGSNAAGDAFHDSPESAPENAARGGFGQGGAELAFFGGTFTALPEPERAACLEFARRWIARGLFRSFRCSTRPDAVDPATLAELRRAGCSLVEIGVQSFADSALAASRRGYDGATARKACRMVRAAGLDLGIQLLPGMPGLDLQSAREDVRACLDLAPACARLYPCLVIEGTALANLWRKGLFTPWSLEAAVDFLAGACRVLEGAGIAVIRMGLADEPGLEARVLAGPRHPEMGNMARGLALLAYIREQVAAWRGERGGADAPFGKPAAGAFYEKTPAADASFGKVPTVDASFGKHPAADAPFDALSPEAALLFAPRRVQGMFWGHGRGLEGAYAALGLTRGRVFFEEREDFLLAPERGEVPGALDARKAL